MDSARWSRPYFQRTSAAARLSMVVFADRRPVDSLEPGVDDGWPRDFAWRPSLQVFDLGDPAQRELFQPHLAGSIRDRAGDILGASAARLDSARVALILAGELADPEDLEHLRAMLALLRVMVRACGAFAALNEVSLEWVDLLELASAPVTPKLTLARWIGVVVETDPGPPFGAIMHSRGMRQFGRPDLLLVGFEEDVLGAASLALCEAASVLAKGAVVRDGDRVLVARLETRDGQIERAEAAVEELRIGENGPDVGLDNDGLILRLDPALLRRIQAAAG